MFEPDDLLLAMKHAAGRPRDLEDIERLDIESTDPAQVPEPNPDQ
jgi:hypothetical protein